MTYYDKLNEFWTQPNDLKPTAIAVYLALLQIQNECGGRSTFTASDRQVMRRLNMKSMRRFTEEKRRLIEKNYIEYIPSKKKGVASQYTI